MPNKFTRRLKSLFSRSGSRNSSRSNSTTSTPTSSPPTSQRNSAASCDAYAADLASLLSASPTATLTENDWEMAMEAAHTEFGLANNSNSNSHASAGKKKKKKADSNNNNSNQSGLSGITTLLAIFSHDSIWYLTLVP